MSSISDAKASLLFCVITNSFTSSRIFTASIKPSPVRAMVAMIAMIGFLFMLGLCHFSHRFSSSCRNMKHG
jgi:hypothetical protein